MPSNEPKSQIKSQEEKSKEGIVREAAEECLSHTSDPTGRAMFRIGAEWGYEKGRTQLIAELAEGDVSAEGLAVQIENHTIHGFPPPDSMRYVVEIIQQDRARVAVRIEKQYEVEIQWLRERVRELTIKDGNFIHECKGVLKERGYGSIEEVTYCTPCFVYIDKVGDGGRNEFSGETIVDCYKSIIEWLGEKK
jgi:hypothetical protein